MTTLEQSVAAEIIALHAVLAGWLNGSLPNDAATFSAGIEDRLADGFFNIQPAGRVLGREELLAGLRAGHGMSPDFDIRIRDVVLRHRLPGGLVVATYEEYQRGARNSEPTNARLSTVVMRPGEPAASWLAVHETWLPQEQLSADLFDF